jgi:ABC-type polysaccharide/polyol phosphate transport system ATPase subunit
MNTSSPPAPVRTAATASRDDVAIEVAGVSKRFKLYHSLASGPIKEFLFFWRRSSYYREFLAVDDVTLRVRRGEVVGIIGSNGAGKTTLLKMIAGLLPVDKGSITVRGRVTALLALGVGVHPEFTGRENIYYGGLLLGMSRDEITAKTPAIIEFAELGEFIDRPFRTYSAGMRARLLFSISMSIDPDILIVDEALATGDAYFVEKCMQRIRQLCRSGATVLLVSHNIAQVRALGSRCILLDRGRLVIDDHPDVVAAEYSRMIFGREAQALAGQPERPVPTGGTGELELTRLSVLDEGGHEATAFTTFGAARVRLEIRSRQDVPGATGATIFLGFIDAGSGAYVGGINSRDHAAPGESATTCTTFRVGRDPVTIEIVLSPLLLMTGHYGLWIQLVDLKGTVLADYRNARRFYVAVPGTTVARECYFTHPASYSVVE